MLYVTLETFFLVPTRSQMLQTYPRSIIKKFCPADMFLLLDAIELDAEVASTKMVNTILHSVYKH